MFFFFFSPAFAEQDEGVPYDSCTQEMIVAVSKVELTFEQELEKFLDLRSSQADEKAKNLTIYLQNYECQLQYVCQVFENPEISMVGDEFSLCIPKDTQKFLKKANIEFSVCASETSLSTRANRLATCQQFIALKKRDSFSFSEKTFTNQSALENQSFLAEKLADIQKRMNVLYEKTRLFSRNFNKVMSDIQCSIPDKSH